MSDSVNGSSSELPVGIDDGLMNPFGDFILLPVTVEVVCHVLFARTWEQKNNVFVILVQSVISDIFL